MESALPADHLPGANHPPAPIAAEPEISPEMKAYLAHKLNIEGYFEEATHWLDGKPIENEEQAEKVQTLLRMIEEAEAEADIARKAEKAPWDAGGDEVQVRYNVLIAPIKNKKPGLTQLAIAGCKKALNVWLLAQQAIADAHAEALRLEEQRATDEARAKQQAIRDAEAPDLTAIIEAEEAIVEAQTATRAADRAEAFKPAARGYGRTVTLRTVHTPVLADPVKALGWCWVNEREAVEACLLQIAERRRNGPSCPIPGVTVKAERRV